MLCMGAAVPGGFCLSGLTERLWKLLCTGEDRDAMKTLSFNASLAATAIFYLAGVYLCPAVQAEDRAAEISRHESAGMEALGRSDYVLGEQEFSLAKAASGDDFVQIRKLDEERAAMYIRRRANDTAIKILQPYIDSVSATPNMYSDYLIALRYDNRTKEAEKYFLLCPYTRDELPVYGVQAVADMYFRNRKYKQAEELYTYLLTRSDDGFIRMGRAYSLAQMGKENAALQEYEAVAASTPRLMSFIAGDADGLIAEGRVNLARKIYRLLGESPAEKDAWQFRYAQVLSAANEDKDFLHEEVLGDKRFYHEANAIFRRLALNPEYEAEAKAHLAHNYIRRNMYASGENLIREFAGENDAALFNVQSANDQRQNNYLYTHYTVGMDRDRNRADDMGVDYEGYIGNDFWLDVNYHTDILNDDSRRAVYGHYYTGLAWLYERGRLRLGYDLFNGAASLNALLAGAEYEFNDVTALSFTTGKRPHGTASAVRMGIDERYYETALRTYLTPRWQLMLSGDVSLLTDSNRYFSYGAEAVYNLDAKLPYRDLLLFGYNRSGYSWNSDDYDSPYKRIDLTAGWSRKWNITQLYRTWELITTLGWSKDNDESFGFAPSLRLEFTQQTAPHQELHAGISYTWYQKESETDTDRRRNSYLMDVGYTWTW